MYFSLAIYHLLVYFGRKSDKNNLYYSLLVLSFAYMTFTFSIIPKMTFLPENVLMEFWHISIIVGYFAITVSITKYILVIFDFKQYEKYINWFIIYAAILEVGTFIISKMPSFTFRQLSGVMIGGITPFGTIIFIFLIIKYINKKNRSKIQDQLALGIFFYTMFFLLHFILLVADVKEEYAISFTNIGMIITVIIFARLLAKNFNREHYELKETKENLENRIKERTRELVQANTLIEKQSREKTDFFINLAHETRTPATLISNYILKCIERYPQDRDLIIVKKNVDKLINDMVNFLDSEKIEQGRLVFENMKICNISDYLVEKAEIVLQTASKKEIKIESIIEKNIKIVTDISALDRIVNNLFDNAIKYTNSNGKIKIKLAKEKDYVNMIITDTGIGIPQEDQKHIFEKYYQVCHKKNNRQGIGMGLSITKAITEQLGGKISFKSNPSGTSFNIELPIINQENDFEIQDTYKIEKFPEYSKNIEIENCIENKKYPTVLIVEDNYDLLLEIKNQLSGNYNVFTSNNGKKALKLLNESNIDIIISDIMMDEMNGYELLESIRKERKYDSIPFIFLSAKTSETDKILGFDRGAIDYISKPFSMEILKAKIKSLLEFENIRKELIEVEKYKAIGVMTASICHQILNPLTVIRCASYNLENILENLNVSEEKLLKNTRNISVNSIRINEIVDTMRSLFRENSFEKQPIEMKSFIESIVEIFKDRYKDIEFVTEMEEEKIEILSHKGALTQIIMNIVGNAAESIIDNPGKIIIKVGKNSVSIQDNGCGIPENEIEEIFKLNYTKKSNSGGTGFGMYIVKELLKKINAEISILSSEEKGTEMKIYW